MLDKKRMYGISEKHEEEVSSFKLKIDLTREARLRKTKRADLWNFMTTGMLKLINMRLRVKRFLTGSGKSTKKTSIPTNGKSELRRINQVKMRFLHHSLLLHSEKFVFTF
jgi:hypothetical protein